MRDTHSGLSLIYNIRVVPKLDQNGRNENLVQKIAKILKLIKSKCLVPAKSLSTEKRLVSTEILPS